MGSSASIWCRHIESKLDHRGKHKRLSRLWTLCEPCDLNFRGKAKGVGKVAGEVVGEAEVMFGVVEG